MSCVRARSEAKDHFREVACRRERNADAASLYIERMLLTLAGENTEAHGRS